MRHRLWLALLVVGFLFATATGAYTSTVAERPVTIDVAEDGEAYLGIEDLTPKELSSPKGSGVAIITLYNQFPSRLDSISASSDSTHITNLSSPDNLRVGDSGKLEADVVCPGQGNSITATITIEASGPDVSVEASEDVTVYCEQNGSGDDSGNEISFVAFCAGEGVAEDDVTIDDVMEDQEGEVVAIDYTVDGPLDSITYKAGMETREISGPDGSGTVETGDGDANSNLSPQDPCPSGQSGVKQEV